MSKRVLLINPSYNYPVKHEMYPSGALLLLGTLAEKYGHGVRITHMVADGSSISDVVASAFGTMLDVAGITVNTYQVRVTEILTKELKHRTAARVVIGGPHPTSIGKARAERDFPYADDIIIGEGEHQFLSILEDKAVTKPQDLEYIPPPNLALVDLAKFTGAYPLGRTPTMSVMASRGCPGQCTYCNRSIFGNRVRYRSPANVLQELQYLASCGVKEVFIQDDTFNLNHAWCMEILRGIIGLKLNQDMVFRAPFRADEKLVNTQLLKLAREAGFWLLFYGVESGSQGMLNRMHKRLSLEEIERAVRLTKEAGIKVETSFIVGLPGETDQTVNDTADFYHKLDPFWSGCSIATPFPSTDLYAETQDQFPDTPFGVFTPETVYFRTDELDRGSIAAYHRHLSSVMLTGKAKSLIRHPRMLGRTIKELVS